MPARRRRGCRAGARATSAVEALAVDPREGAAVAAREVEELEVYRLKSRRPATKTSLVQLDGVRGALIHGCRVPRTGEAFVAQLGTKNSDVQVVAPGKPR